MAAPLPDIGALLRQERAILLASLGGLTERDWRRHTACPGWDVHDLVAHVWGTDLAVLARLRDGWAEPIAADTREKLVAELDECNEAWVRGCRQVGPSMLLDGLRRSGAELSMLFAHADLDAPGEAIAWADLDPAPVWLCGLRELTERFVHRHQIREALGLAPREDDDNLVGAVLDTFVYAFPVGLGSVSAAEGSTVEVEATGAVRRRWRFRANPEGWVASGDGDAPLAAALRAPADVLWRLLAGTLTAGEIVARVRFEGDPRLYTALRDTRAVLVAG